ncbi:hypothetical protein [Brenneria uluponensis]|uniref:hypothetical protein n=1 Tax=Brenneria uluponensis TaxID=3057057 RepID=UPI0028E70CD8|nr:hypothetical protein [Brenneria ulupoensis]
MPFLVFPFILTLIACFLTSKLVKPVTSVLVMFPVPSGLASITDQTADSGWHRMFGDLRLPRLTVLSLVNNRDLLDAGRQLYAICQTLLGLRRNEISNAVTLYKALESGLVNDSSVVTIDAANAQNSMDSLC